MRPNSKQVKGKLAPSQPQQTSIFAPRLPLWRDGQAAALAPVRAQGSTSPTVTAAIDAHQRGDGAEWSSQFKPGADLFDDGTPRSLEKFTGRARSRAIHVDRTSRRRGLEVIGAFHPDQWGGFKTFGVFPVPALKSRVVTTVVTRVR